MGRTAKDITDAELAVMNLIWEQGPATTDELIRILYRSASRSSYVVLQGLLKRLEQKGFIRRNRKKYPHHIEPKIDRDALIDRSLRTIADKLCGGSVDPLLRHLLNAHCSARQLNTIRDLIS